MKGAIDHPHLLGHSELGLLDPTLKESNDNNDRKTELHRAPLDLSVPDPTQIFSSRVISTKNVYSLSCTLVCSLHACLWIDTATFFFFF